ncbi:MULTISPECIES: ClpXP protease specificity-enhancing factor [unclassified Neisseria]|uniref:ClpXP protease specificity-enhancing factor n=1 Tax=unclassified Neisseria TaxID=2623750 RepID=UPI001071B069|nr:MULTISPECIES: ClpXP protease specificity-enhancing factor [unclassified Neisseria]MBF0803895.1 ClpXP protease specificity-enhancing factor [Neisseria sp. 19428wB4_WF04]TFU43407.1 ClpXP protease specificity-enhancing factor [Neisseria sp. WF04]
MTTTSTKPYLLRAFYEWCLDNNQTPHIVAWVNEHTRVPMQYVRDNEIVLNIGTIASHALTMDNEWIHFSARFGGVAHEIWIPIGHVISIFARESGEGMGFEVEPYQTDSEKKGSSALHLVEKEQPEAEAEVGSAPEDGGGNNAARPKKGLKLVK